MDTEEVQRDWKEEDSERGAPGNEAGGAERQDQTPQHRVCLANVCAYPVGLRQKWLQTAIQRSQTLSAFAAAFRDTQVTPLRGLYFMGQDS